MKKIYIPSLIILLFGTYTTFAQETEPVRVGVILDMTASTGEFGIRTNNGINLAVGEINARGGINGRKIQVFLKDTTGRPETAKQVAHNLITITKVHAIIGEVASTNSLAAAPEAQDAKIPMITPSSTNPMVTAVGDYIFRACFIDPFQGELMARFAFNDLGSRRVAILWDIDSKYSSSLKESFVVKFKKLDGRILIDQHYTSMDQDFRKELRKIRQLKPDAIYLPGYYSQVAIIAKQARRMGMNMPILGGDGWDSPELWKLGESGLKNSYVTSHFSAYNPSLEVKSFVKKYETKYSSPPDTFSALGYDTVYLLADAISRAGTTNGPELRNAIAKTKDFPSVTGKITINADRNAMKPVVILKLDEKLKKFVYRATILPDSNQ